MPSRRLEQKLTKENLWLYILSLLKEKDMYGYELREVIAKRFGFKPGNVTAYRVSYALQRQGLIRKIEKSVDGRERKYYHITAAGTKELNKGKALLRSILAML